MTAANLRILIALAASRLEESQIDSPLLDAEVLLAHTLDVDRSYLLAHDDLVPSPAQHSCYLALIERRVAREPLAYLTGRRWFYGLEFVVSPDVLIPRPETELLVELAGKWLSERPDITTTVVDVGTGSGAIAVSVAGHRSSTVHIIATDLAPEALAMAKQNAEIHHVLHRITFAQSDLLENVNTTTDLILSNPPYIPTADLSVLMPEVSVYEPPLALDGGHDGLQVIERLLSQARQKMIPHGALFIEIGYDQGKRTQESPRHYFPEANVSIHQDLADLDRVLAISLT